MYSSLYIVYESMTYGKVHLPLPLSPKASLSCLEQSDPDPHKQPDPHNNYQTNV